MESHGSHQATRTPAAGPLLKWKIQSHSHQNGHKPCASRGVSHLRVLRDWRHFGIFRFFSPLTQTQKAGGMQGENLPAWAAPGQRARACRRWSLKHKGGCRRLSVMDFHQSEAELISCSHLPTALHAYDCSSTEPMMLQLIKCARIFFTRMWAPKKKMTTSY